MTRAATHLLAVPTPPAETTTVVVAEDHAAMRWSLRRLLEGTPGVGVVAEAGDLALTRRHLAAHRPDVLVLDLSMPEGSSLDLAEELGDDRVAVVLVSDEDTPGFAARAFAAGAAAYVLKERADEELPDALRAAVRGERYLSPLVADRLAS